MDIRGWGAKTLLKDKANHQYFQRLNAEIPDYPGPSFSNIELDIPRVFNCGDQIISTDARAKMLPILKAYFKRNATIGYWQWMGYVAGILSRQMSEEQAFWVMWMLIECILLSDYYTQNITGVLVDIEWYNELLELFLPKVKRQLDKNLVTSIEYIPKWFSCWYANIFPFQVVEKVWDFMFWQGMIIIYKVALALMSLMSNDILNKWKDQEDFHWLLNNFPESLSDPYVLINEMSKFEITHTTIRNLRKKHNKEIYWNYDKVQLQLYK